MAQTREAKLGQASGKAQIRAPEICGAKRGQKRGEMSGAKRGQKRGEMSAVWSIVELLIWILDEWAMGG